MSSSYSVFSPVGWAALTELKLSRVRLPVPRRWAALPQARHAGHCGSQGRGVFSRSRIQELMLHMWDVILSRTAHQDIYITVVKSLPCVKTLRLSNLECDSLSGGPRVCILTRFLGDSDAQLLAVPPLCLTGWILNILKTLPYLTLQPNARSSSWSCNRSARHSCYRAVAFLPLVPFFSRSSVPRRFPFHFRLLKSLNSLAQILPFLWHFSY